LTRYIVIALCSLISSISLGQNEAPEIPPKIIPEYHFNLAYTGVVNDVEHIEVGLNKDLINLASNNLRLGLGIRMGLQDSKPKNYTSAHTDIKGIDDHLDTLQLGRVQSVSFNMYFNGEYFVSKHISFGMAVDLLGISTGLTYEGDYAPGVTSQEYRYFPTEEVEAKPTESNAFWFGNSKGCLNTQLYTRIPLSRKVSMRLGVSYLFQEFSTELGYGAFKSYRFENNNLAFFAGITFNRFDEK
jgi:hypothetical protein